MARPSRYSEELRERAVRMVAEVRPDYGSQWAAITAVASKLHFTPTYSSWLNLVERFFGYVTADLLQRSDHRNVQALEADIRKWVTAWNENPNPFCGPRPPTRSSPASGDLFNGSQTQGPAVASAFKLDIVPRAFLPVSSCASPSRTATSCSDRRSRASRSGCSCRSSS
jgi:hypothetical protein